MAGSDVHRTIQAVFRIESARLIAGLARIVRDVGRAEELAQDALVAALEQWPREGTPDNPGAWLMASAKHRAFDELRRKKRFAQKHEALGLEIEARRDLAVRDVEEAIDDDVGDDLLRLIVTACHPILPIGARVALTLRLLGGLTTDEIARALFVAEPTIAQRIVRAKKTLAEAKVPFEVPRGEALAERMASVLQVIYLIFNEGYAATAGEDWVRPALCEDALRLGRILAELSPNDPEVLGLVALMELQASRLRARSGRGGEPIRLLDQDRARWDRLLIGRGLRALDRARQLAGEGGVYVLQAEIAACHARATEAAKTDWKRIAWLYAWLVKVTSSPVVELNRAVALSMAFGPEAALPIVEALADEGALDDYPLLSSVRADLLAKLGRLDEARVHLERAASLSQNASEQHLLQSRLSDLDEANVP